MWIAALLDHPGESPHGSALLLIDGLLKPRDLPDNIWNADTLYLLTPSPAAALELARCLTEAHLGGEVTVYEDPEETETTLGEFGHDYGTEANNHDLHPRSVRAARR